MTSQTPSEIWVLDKLHPGWEDHALVNSLRALGVDAGYVDWSEVTIDATGLYHKRAFVERPELVLVRSRVFTRNTEGDLSLIYNWIEMLSDLGSTIVNSASAFRVTKNKIRQAQLLSSHGIRVPPTRVVRTMEEVEACLKHWGITVLKPICGHSSVDLMRLKPGADGSGHGSLLGTQQEICAWHALNRHHVLCAQPFIPNRDRDLRVCVVGEKIVSCHFRASGAPDSFVKALDFDFRREPADLTEEIVETTQMALKILGLEIATLDYIEGAEGLYLLEVNSSFSLWEPLEQNDFDLTEQGITDFHARYLVERLAARSDIAISKVGCAW